jgi:1,4-alpha-glucan branching enzyme
MGNEIGQWNEWNHDQSLDWHLLMGAEHAGVQAMLRNLNRVYRDTPALHEVDFSDNGFEWLDWDDRENSVLSWLRRDTHGGFVVCVTNLTPVVREGYRLGVPEEGNYHILFNSDDEEYCGSGAGARSAESVKTEHHGRPYSIELTLPPLSTIILERK